MDYEGRNPSSSRHDTSVQHRSSASIPRRDIIANLDPFLRREQQELTLPASEPPSIRNESAALPFAESGSRRPKIEGVHQSRLKNANSENYDDIFATATAPETWRPDETKSKDCSRAQSRQLISQLDRRFISTYPFRIVEHLRLCDTVVDVGDDEPKYACGFECAHCRGEGYREFPETLEEVADEIANFRSHLNYCIKAPYDLRRYLWWMERNDSLLEGGSSMRSLATLISHRLDVAEARGGYVLAKARDRALRKKRKTSHSVLENVESLASATQRTE